MGGLIVFTAISIPYLVLSDRDTQSLAVFGVALGCAALGFADDFMKIVKRRSLGLSARWKLLLPARPRRRPLVRRALRGRARLDDRAAHLRRRARHPRRRSTCVLVFLVIAGASNAVNLTDGLDGLAAGCCAIVLLAYTAITFVTNEQENLALLSRLPGRRLHRLPLVQRLPGVDLHGGHRLARPGRRDRRAGGDDPDRGPADHHRRHLRDRGALGRAPGRRPSRPSAAASC